MTPPGATAAGQGAGAAEPTPAVSASLEVLKNRRDFLCAARGLRATTRGFVLQARERGNGAVPIRVGFTCSRKVGNAVARNRAKRRLREIARLTLARNGRPGWDYVLIGRRETTCALPFGLLLDDLTHALATLHGTTA